MDTMKKLITLNEIAEIYSLSLPTLKRWASERRFPLYRISNRIRVSESEFREWIEDFKINNKRLEDKNDK